ncbi:MAG: enoyl-CoA hydratase/isomerase family protein [Polyangiaceae bacterium]|nr:enoyl-CoA hydratase/isomerase family protein [Polyangiaceae bacterium]
MDGRTAILTLDNAPLNPLAEELVSQLWAAVDRVAAEPEVTSAVLIGARDTFVAGADIRRLQRLAKGEPVQGDEARSLSALISRLESSEKPFVAAIDGFALGGGLELAMGCHGRIASEGAKLGLPELNLGLIPGAGGTQRLPRLIGLSQALDCMLSSKQLSAVEALELGLVSEVVPRSALLERALALATALTGSPLQRSSEREDKLPKLDEALRTLESARQQHSKRFRNVEYPELCLEAVMRGLEEGAPAGLLHERECFRQCLEREAAQSLIHLFFAERSASKVAGITDQGFARREFRRLGVIGGGTMGSGIATAALQRGLTVVLTEQNEAAADAAKARVAGFLEHAKKRGRLSETGFAQAMARLSCSAELAGVSDCDVVIEAATEDLELKRGLFARLLDLCPADTILATNTSTLPLERIAQNLEQGHRILGAHFFSPAHVMRLVEVVRTPASEPEQVNALIGLVKLLKKTPVVVGSSVGFLVNRVMMPYGQAAGLLIDRGVDPYRLDRVMTDFGMPMGPCRVSDLAGVDVGVYAGSILDAAYPDRAYRSPLRKRLVEAGRLGEKRGLGHYRYVAGQAEEDPELIRFVERCREELGSPSALEFTDSDIVECLLFLVVNEACRVLEEGHAERPSDVDLALQLGMGFPGYRGGPMAWADRRGSDYVAERLAEWHSQTGLGIFKPSARLARLASARASLLAD